MRQAIQNYNNYSISSNGNIFNSKGYRLKPRVFKNTIYVRLFRGGERHTVSVNRLLFEQFELVDKHLPLSSNEVGIRYKQTHYYITNKLRCYNAKTRRFLKPVYRNEYVSYSICFEGRKVVVYALNFAKNHLCNEVN